MNDLPPHGNLLRNCVLFGRLLRALGVETTPTQIVALTEALDFIPIGNRQDFKNAARAILINRREHLPIFERAFDLFWRPHTHQTLSELDFSVLTRPRARQQQVQWRSDSAGASNDDGPQLDEPQIDKIFTYSDQELLRRRDFSTLNDDELATIRRMMQSMVWRLEPRRTRRMTRAPRGEILDLRRTLRQNLRYGGETLRLARKTRKYKRRPLVLICDISGSMERYSRLLLQFVYIVTSRLDRVESFVFSTRLTRITRQLRTRNVDRALDDASAAIHDWAGGTRIGEAIRTFNYRWARRVLGQGAVVMIISDGWDRGDVELLGREMDRLHRSCQRLIWLNPLLGAESYEPLVRGIQAAMPYIDDFLPVHNLKSLEELAHVLARV